MISLLAFFLLLSSGSFYVTARFHRRYEETVPLTIFCAVELVFPFGLLDNLKLGFYAVCLVMLALYALGARQLAREKDMKAFRARFFTPAFFIFLFLMVLCAVLVVGRVAYEGDEFSYWAVSVKKMWYLNMLPCVPEAEPYFTEYPPGMQLFEYLAMCFCGRFSEWRMVFAYLCYVIALFLPFLRERAGRKPIRNILTALVVLTSSSIFYSSFYDNLMVDCALGATFAFAIASTFLLDKRENGWDRLQLLSIVMAANMLILIKSAGKLLAAYVLLALVLSIVCAERKAFLRLPLKRQAHRLALLLFPFLTAWLWKLKYTQTQAAVAFDSGAYDIGEFLRILCGAEVGYRTDVLHNFLAFFQWETADVGILPLNNLLIVFLLAGVLFAVCFGLRRQALGNMAAVWTLLVGLPVYWLGLLASYMYTFSEEEGVRLASMQRYLNIYHTGLLLTVVFLLLLWADLYPAHAPQQKFIRSRERKACVCLLCVLLMVPLLPFKAFILRENVDRTQAYRAPFEVLTEQIRVDGYTGSSGEKPCALLICRGGYPHVPVNHFTYLLWPSYRVPWECSYGSTNLFEGDGYTQILTAGEFRQHIAELGVDYIALYYLDDDFIQQYSSLFDAPLANGQVYRVIEDQPQYTLLQPAS